ncbi:MAG: DUF3343 domain-containing protein [Oscillospiraceae bacterium]|nr:DUF3343 domain-containing protein [Oscillospiraceae bacterium]
MEYIAVKIGSVNSAAMLKKLIKRHGFDSYVVHTPAHINKGGCSYSVKFDKNILDTVKRISLENNIRIKGIYADKGGEYYDLS